MDELSAADRRVLTLEAVQGREQELRLVVIDVPDVAPRLGVADAAENLDAVMAVENLEGTGLFGMRTDDQEGVASGPVDVGAELLLQVLRHDVAVERMCPELVQRDRSGADPGRRSRWYFG